MVIGGEKFHNVLIIGGTGCLGQQLIKSLYSKDHELNITVLSRDEHKQQNQKKIFPEVRYVLGDIRDKNSIKREFRKKDVVFHVAALKHIDHLEENPIESVRTNIMGTINVAESAIDNGVSHCVFSSTDKAVESINTYGASKFISERILQNFNSQRSGTFFSTYRWGNVAGSTGSAIPFFIECIQKGNPVPITDSQMSRYWVSIEDAVAFMLETFTQRTNEVKIPPKMKAAPVTHVVHALIKILNAGEIPIKIVGKRKGEKLHESLMSIHSDRPSASNTCPQYTEKELIALLKPIVDQVTRKR